MSTLGHSQNTAGICSAIAGIGEVFPNQKIYVLVEAEITKLEKRARPEDIVVWIEGVGVFVIEIKSHDINGIRSIENNIPVVMYTGEACSDKDLIEQPRSFAYLLKSSLEKLSDQEDIEMPSLYYAGWLINVSPEDIASRDQIEPVLSLVQAEKLLDGHFLFLPLGFLLERAMTLE